MTDDLREIEERYEERLTVSAFFVFLSPEQVRGVNGLMFWGYAQIAQIAQI